MSVQSHILSKNATFNVNLEEIYYEIMYQAEQKIKEHT